MLVLFPLLASANVLALAAFLWNDLQTVTLMMVGVLLFAAGTVLRHRLSAVQSGTDSRAYPQWIERRPPNKYVPPVTAIGSTPSTQHANVV